MKILVTGATGFIGNHVISQLLKTNHQVIATSTSFEKATSFPWFSKVEFKAFNLNEDVLTENIYDFFNRPDKLIHLAWQGLPNFKDISHFELYLAQHYTFIKRLLKEGLNDLTITGTCLEYGLQEGELSEEDCLRPSTAYAIAKNSLRLFLEQLSKSAPFILKWVRLFYMYGQGQHPKSILPALQTAIDNGDREFMMSGGAQTRDYMRVEDVAESIIAIALQKKITGAINCSSNQPITISQLVEHYLEETGQSIVLKKGAYPYPDYEPMHFWGSNDKLKSILKDRID